MGPSLRRIARLGRILVLSFLAGTLSLGSSWAHHSSQRSPLREQGSQVVFPTAYGVMFGGGGIYMEAMYPPPVTTGPWAPAWSPDGKQITFALQGSLWNVSVEGGEASQLTSGPHYDCEPAWSADGRMIAFTRDIGNAIELWVVDADGSNPRQLTRRGGLNINPRWLPDNNTIVFTSSGEEKKKRFGIWAVFANDGSMRPVLSDQFQNITPTPSPDGQQVVFVSNRPLGDKPILGTGGLWKIAMGSISPTLLLQEETLWHARPVWSPDGRKIAYVSFRSGHQQLWVLSSIAANPIQLTFTDGEVFVPTWSPDNQKIAFISNAGGTFTLWTIPAMGGNPSPVPITGYRHSSPVGRLEVRIKDGGTGRLAAARVFAKASDGKSYAPLGAFHRVSTITDDHYFHTPGEFAVNLPTGKTTVEVMRGFEFRPQSKEVNIVAGQTQKLDFTLERISDLPALGWYSGDNHIHMNYGGIFEASPETLLREAASEDLHVANNMVANHNTRIFDMKYFEGRLSALSRPNNLVYFNQEYRSSFPGHLSLLNLKRYVYPAYVAANTARAAVYPALTQVLEIVHKQGGVGGYVHPFYAGDMLPRRSKEFPVSVALGELDYYDLMCIWSDEYRSADEWYRVLNLGFRIPASAGSDVMTNYWRAPAVGSVRVYARSGTPLVYADWIRGLTAGRTFVTNGPLLFFRVDGREPGDEIRVGPGKGTNVPVEIEARSIVPMEKVDIIQNGKVVFSVKATDPYRVKVSTTVPVERSGWIAARATGPEKQRLLMDSYVYAHTSPVYLIKGGMPTRSPQDARYFMEWIDEVMELLAKQPFDTREQKEEVLQVWRRARQVFVDLSQE